MAARDTLPVARDMYAHLIIGLPRVLGFLRRAVRGQGGRLGGGRDIGMMRWRDSRRTMGVIDCGHELVEAQNSASHG